MLFEAQLLYIRPTKQGLCGYGVVHCCSKHSFYT